MRALLHFALLGGLLFVLDPRPPTEPSLPLLSGEDLLYREARSLGLHRSDAIVRRRLVRNMRFLDPESSQSDESLFAEALELGMDRSDLVVRRRLIQRRVLEIRMAARDPAPDDAELERYLGVHGERFAAPARMRLSQIFLSRDRRGAHLEMEARALLAELQRSAREPETADGLGDPLPLPTHPPASSRRELAAAFGEAFAHSVFELEPGAWQGPVASSYGLHLVWVHERDPARPARLEEVRGAVREALLEERGNRALEERLSWLRAPR